MTAEERLEARVAELSSELSRAKAALAAAAGAIRAAAAALRQYEVQYHDRTGDTAGRPRQARGNAENGA